MFVDDKRNQSFPNYTTRMSTQGGVLSCPSFEGSSLECESSVEVTEIQSDDLPSYKSIAISKSREENIHSIGLSTDQSFKNFQGPDEDKLLFGEDRLAPNITRDDLQDVHSEINSTTSSRRQSNGNHDDSHHGSSETLCNNYDRSKSNSNHTSDNENCVENTRAINMLTEHHSQNANSDSLNSSANDESSLALLDPKLLASIDSNDVFASNRTNSLDYDLPLWSPKKSSQEYDLAFDIKSLQQSDSKNMLVKQFSLYPEENENFAPQGSSSPLPFHESEENENVVLPKIISPRDGTICRYDSNASETSLTRKKSIRKLSHDNCVVLPSRSGLSTPKSSDVSRDTEEGLEIPPDDVAEQSLQKECNSKIPRYVRNRQKSTSSVSGPTKRKLKNQIQASPKTDKAAKKLGQHKSHSVSNLSKISVKDYHQSSIHHSEQKSLMKSSRKSLSFDCLQTKTSVNSQHCVKEKKSNRFSHVQSKVREYIQGANHLRKHLPSTMSESEDLYGRSFVLSPGRKSLSMSNIAHGNQSSGRRTSKSDLAKMKSFLSSRHLDGVQVTIFGPRLSQSRESLCLDAQFDSSRISRLLDHLSDDNEDLGSDYKKTELKEYDDGLQDGQDVCVYPVGNNVELDDDEIVLDVEDLLQLALEERKGKEEAKKVLCQLQENYDALQRKYANAENIIDKYRFGGSSNDIRQTDYSQPANEPQISQPSSTAWKWPSEHDEPNSAKNVTENIDLREESTSTIDRLKEILDQLYALELVSSSSNSMMTASEKRKLLDHLRNSFDEVQVLTEKDYSSHLTRNNSDVPHNLLIEVGLKLQAMESKFSGPQSFDEKSEKWVVDQFEKFHSSEKEKLLTETSSSKTIDNSLRLSRESHQVSDLFPTKPLSSLEHDQDFSLAAKAIQQRLNRSTSLSGEDDTGEKDKNRPSQIKINTPQYELKRESERSHTRAKEKFFHPQKCPEMSKKMCLEEKVEKWCDLNRLEVTEKRVKSNLPSCYGSCPTSPTTGSGSREALDQTDRQRKSFDFDSGCPGSDRSTQNITKRASPISASAQSSLLNLGSPALLQTSSHSGKYQLFNVDEGEEKSSNVDSLNCTIYDKSPLNSARSSKALKSKTIANHVPQLRLQRDAFHSVTDLSSDEQSNIGLEINENLSSAKTSPRPQYIPPLVSPKSNAASQTLTPRGALPILAHQIDQEILELRNLYEGHREEMFTLLNGGDFSLKRSEFTGSNCPKSQIVAPRPQESVMESESDYCKMSVQEERRLEFQQRRLRLQQRKKQSSQRFGNHESLLPNFAIGKVTTPDSAPTKSHGISAFFPNVSDGIDGRRIAACDGEEIFIPKLSLDELCSEASENFQRNRDQRSFDFGQSLEQAEETGSGPPAGVSPLSLNFSSASSALRTRRMVLPLIDQCCQVNNNESLLINDNLRRCVSAGQLTNTESSNRPIIIVQNCCGHTGRSFLSESADQLINRDISTTVVQKDEKISKEKKKVTTKHRKRKKNDSKDLLESLIQANKLAQTLKQKSAEMIEVIEQDLKLLRSLETCTITERVDATKY